MRPVRSRLVRFVHAREELRKRKAAGLLPWSTDPILSQYRFTNVRRRHDRVSQWLLAHVLYRVDTDVIDLYDFLLFTALCRWVNWPPTIMEIMQAGLWPATRLDLAAIGQLIDRRVARGEKAWTGAYMVRAKIDNMGGKGAFVANEVVAPLRTRLLGLHAAISTRSRRAVWDVLYNSPNWGPFMAGQVVDDWGWTSLLHGATDVYTWAPPGPGSLRGFNRMLGLPLKTPHAEEEWCQQLIKWRGQVISALGSEYEDLSLADVQNVLCELDKYERTRLGEGRPRSHYQPETAY